jgi:hypothetical protein
MDWQPTHGSKKFYCVYDGQEIIPLDIAQILVKNTYGGTKIHVNLKVRPVNHSG